MTLTVTNAEAGMRLDIFLSGIDDLALSRSGAVRLIEDGSVTVNGKPESKKYLLKVGDEITAEVKEPEEYEALPENIPLDVVYEDTDIIVINKPKGMVVHPAPGNYTGTLVNALLYHCKDSLSGIGGVMRPGIVHRIDKDTSGLLVVAKNDFSHTALSRELEYHGIVREYRALVSGGFSADSGTVNLPIGRHPKDRKKMAVLTATGASAKPAVTHYKVLASSSGISYLSLELETGRTHQIRVHMSHLGHSLLGDEVYGGGRTLFEKKHATYLRGQALHAKKLTLTHPRTNERMTFTSPLPKEFQKLLEILEFDSME